MTFMFKKRWLAVTAICVSIFAVLGFIKFMQIRAAIAFGESFPEPSETVQSAVLQLSDWQPQLKVSGELRAPKELVLRNEVAGVIADIGFVAGSQVKQGDKVLQLDVAEEMARLNALEAQVDLAEKDFRRLSGIKNERAVSKQLVDQARSRLDVAKADLANVKESIANKTVIAPFDGMIGLHDLEVGEYMAANTVVTRLVGDTSILWVDFNLPQQLSDINIGDAVVVEIEGVNNAAFSATVSVVEPGFSRSTRGLGVRAVLNNVNGVLKPGAFVNVVAPIGESRAVWRVPSAAVRSDAFGNFIHILKRDDKQQLRSARMPVFELAKQGAESILSAESKLEAGLRYATVGAYKLRDGVLVKLADSRQSDAATNVDLNSNFADASEIEEIGATDPDSNIERDSVAEQGEQSE